MTSGLRRSFGRRVVLDGLDLEVRRGEAFGFLGPNGSGKTTTIRLLLGLLRPHGGRIELFGQPLAGGLPDLLRRVGAMVEAPAFFPYLTGRENLQFLAKEAGLDGWRVDEALALAQLEDAAERPFGTYSVGMRQRLGLAAALLRDPELLILDEPTTGLDPEAQWRFKELVPVLKERGRTVFISSHSLEQVAEICDRVAILKAGRCAAVGSVAELLWAKTVVEVRAPDPERARAALLRHPWVSAVDREAGWLRVAVEEGWADAVNPALVRAGIVAHEVRVAARSLESVYREVVHGEAA